MLDQSRRCAAAVPQLLSTTASDATSLHILPVDAEGFLIMNEPPAVSTKYDGREWALEVPQQPIRARMCGFGDKVCAYVGLTSRRAKTKQDRRPITPPPCVRLIVRDPMTGREIDAQ